jgi:hypothetical protein
VDFLDDVFNQLGGFEVGDYGDEDPDAELLSTPVTKKNKSAL